RLLLPHADALGLELPRVCGPRARGRRAATGAAARHALPAALGRGVGAARGPLRGDLAGGGGAYPQVLWPRGRSDLPAGGGRGVHAAARARGLLPRRVAANSL